MTATEPQNGKRASLLRRLSQPVDLTAGTPWRVILNESVELAKEFGSGYRITNAVLEKIAHEVRPAETAE